MEHIHWTEKSIEFENLIDDSTIKKPTLAQIGNKTIVVGVKIDGEFIMASPCKAYNDQFIPMEQEIVLSSKHQGIWKVISRVTSKKEDRIHRLSTQDIERIYIQDMKNDRLIPRLYICTKEIEVFDLIIHSNDLTVVDGQRIIRQMMRIEENVQFEICDIGEIEYTPTENELTSQDYIIVPKRKSRLLFAFRKTGSIDEEKLIRNRVLRSLYCVTKNEPYPRYFFLEVNEKPCDIHPIASEGSSELRYLHSTQNLFDYISSYESNISLFVKLLQGKVPRKAINSNGYMLFRRTLIGDKVPIYLIKDHVICLVNPDLPVEVKVPINRHRWHTLLDTRKAELKCMQLSLTLLSRDESEIYVTVEDDKIIANYLKSNDNPQQQQSSDRNEKHTDDVKIIRYSQILSSKTGNNTHLKQLTSTKNFSNNDKILSNQQKTKLTKSTPFTHSTSDKFCQNHDKQIKQNGNKNKRQHSKQDEKSHEIQQTIFQDKSILLSSSLSSSTFNKHKH
ncbi:unnamed protein product [Rotaria sp. Silwood2]|nr:unnamed protein product [Rotaria sp. Silwood2]CAF2886657.1 unnamed protein product [Rotaria sp. Silwood2]CAF3921245.1 unnamed protein product [Rotaria sp. Silwood2]